MFGRGAFGIVAGIVLVLAIVGGAAALGFWAYNAGVANGLAQGGSSGAPEAVAPYFYAPYGFRHYGFGFGPFGCLIPLLFLFLIFGAMRMLFWPRWWGWGHGGWGRHGPHGPGEWPGGMRERAEEWHRQMHGEEPERPPEAEA